MSFHDSGIARAGLVQGTRASNGWHSDITFERVPSDYAVSLDKFLGPTYLIESVSASQDAHSA